MYIYATHAQTSVIVCYEHRQLAEEQGWYYLEYREPDDQAVVGWDCYFEDRYKVLSSL